MRAYRVNVSGALLSQSLKLPEGCEVIQVRDTNALDNTFELVITNPAFPEVPEGAKPPIVTPVCHYHAINDPAELELYYPLPHGVTSWSWDGQIQLMNAQERVVAEGLAEAERIRLRAEERGNEEHDPLVQHDLVRARNPWRRGVDWEAAYQVQYAALTAANIDRQVMEAANPPAPPDLNGGIFQFPNPGDVAGHVPDAIFVNGEEVWREAHEAALRAYARPGAFYRAMQDWNVVLEARRRLENPVPAQEPPADVIRGGHNPFRFMERVYERLVGRPFEPSVQPDAPDEENDVP